MCGRWQHMSRKNNAKRNTQPARKIISPSSRSSRCPRCASREPLRPHGRSSFPLFFSLSLFLREAIRGGSRIRVVCLLAAVRPSVGRFLLRSLVRWFVVAPGLNGLRRRESGRAAAPSRNCKPFVRPPEEGRCRRRRCCAREPPSSSSSSPFEGFEGCVSCSLPTLSCPGREGTSCHERPSPAATAATKELLLQLGGE